MGDEFQVNSDEKTFPLRPSVAMVPDGAFTVVWFGYDPSGGDFSDLSIHGRRFTEGGLPVGDAFAINTYTTGRQDEVDVGVDDSGNFVVVWDSYGSSGTDTERESIQMRSLGLIFADGFESRDTSAWSNTNAYN